MGDDETLLQRDIQVSLQDVVFGITPHSPLWGFFLPFSALRRIRRGEKIRGGEEGV